MPENLLRTLPVVILAGGLGTRLRPAVADRPKGLAPIGGKPFLEIQIELLADQGAKRFVLCVGHLAGQIEAHLGDGSRWGVHIEYSLEQERLLGTAGALKLAQRWFDPQALVLNGDTYFALDYRRLVEHHRLERRRAGVLATIALARAPDAARYGSVLLDAAGRHLAGFAEKGSLAAGTARWLNAGAYVLERELIERIPADRPASLERDVFPEVLQSGGRIAALTSEELFFDIGTPEGLDAFARYMAKRPAFFLDRDGVVIEEVGYLSEPAQVRLLPGSADAIACLNRRAIAVIVVTNQAGIAHGYFPESQVAAVHRRLDELLAGHGARVDAYYYCPHHPQAAVAAYRRACPCRKPSPGMLIRAAREHGLSLQRSWLVGDKWSDLEAGAAAGCRVVLVRTGYGAEVEKSLGDRGPGGIEVAAVEVAADLAEAVRKHLDWPLRTSRAA